ncbi:MAG: alcohol dehydrogenase catalytic domain-containing protein [Verrucomicrobia bacterium]|nr:alcohol dehydrogenase catalytic domain-containing protein [Verrucomicrobiota bacterium]
MNVPATMKALQLTAPGKLSAVELPVPQPGPDEVLVRTVATTICTSDLNDIAHNPFGIALPRVLGHEGAGTVAALGRRVQGFQPGELVAAHPVIPCGHCENCRRGLAHLCARMGHLGLDRDGTFAEFFCIRADRVRRAPVSLPAHAASLLEPVAVCLEAVQRGRIQSGDSVVVVGDGPFGILIARLASKHSPKTIILVGRHEFRLRQVPSVIAINEKDTPNVLGTIRAAIRMATSSATSLRSQQPSLPLPAQRGEGWGERPPGLSQRTSSPRPSAPSEEEREETSFPETFGRTFRGGAGADVAIMATGTQSALDLCAACLRARGRLVVFSALQGRAALDLFRLHTQELEILGACNDQDLIDPALERLADPALALASLVTHRVPFGEWPRAFELARGRKDEALKVALIFPETA